MQQLIIKTVLLSALWVSCIPYNKNSSNDSLKYNVYKNETFFMGKTQITSVFNLIDCEKLTKPINAADVEKVLVPNYLSLDLQLIPIHNDTAKNSFVEMKHTYQNRCVILGSNIVEYLGDSVIAFKSSRYTWSIFGGKNNSDAVKLNQFYDKAFADTLRKYKSVLNPWLFEEAKRRGVFDK